MVHFPIAYKYFVIACAPDLTPCEVIVRSNIRSIANNALASIFAKSLELTHFAKRNSLSSSTEDLQVCVLLVKIVVPMISPFNVCCLDKLT